MGSLFLSNDQIELENKKVLPHLLQTFCGICWAAFLNLLPKAVKCQVLLLA